MHSVKCATYWDYISLLNKDPGEYDRLIESLTIKVSEFFRDHKVFDLLGNIIIPEIVSQKQAQGAKKIRAWSCGAAFGQEAYSMAILFCEELGIKVDGFDISILATDIDKNAINKASWGSYDKKAMHKIKPYLLLKYFTQVKDRYVVNDRVRSLVTFRYHEIVSGRQNSGMDLVVCRNLLIYFQKDLQEKALHNLYATLSPGGFLILGMTESIPNKMRDYFDLVNLRERVYRKKSAVSL
jgi:chemotaxis protein methyltransferase CheR